MLTAIALVAVAGGVVSGAGARGLREQSTSGVFSQLDAVSCASSSDCWAVGWYSPPGTGILTEALHWDGHSWKRAETPNPGGAGRLDQNGLSYVTCVSTKDCWATGAFYHPHVHGSRALLLHWDGSKWSLAPLPQSNGALGGISCLSASDCWLLAGHDQALHWNGHRWSALPLPAGVNAQAITCLSASSCGAVGSRRPRAGSHALYRDSILRWNGRRWAVVPAPNPGRSGRSNEARLSAVACTASAHCFAVGDYAPPSLLHLDQAARWNGGHWTNITATLPQSRRYHPNWLDGIACPSRSDCWAVGALGKGQTHLNQIQHWNDHAWSLAPAPQPGGKTGGDTNVLDGVSCQSATDCWAVGWSQRAGKPNVNEILRWNGHKWSNQPAGR